MSMTLRAQAAAAIDATLSVASMKRGIYTDKARETLAAYLDGAIQLRASMVRTYVRYLLSVA